MDLRTTVQIPNRLYRGEWQNWRELLSYSFAVQEKGLVGTPNKSLRKPARSFPHTPPYPGVCVAGVRSHGRTQRGSAPGARLGTTAPRRLCESGREEAVAAAGRARAASPAAGVHSVVCPTAPGPRTEDAVLNGPRSPGRWHGRTAASARGTGAGRDVGRWARRPRARQG